MIKDKRQKEKEPSKKSQVKRAKEKEPRKKSQGRRV